MAQMQAATEATGTAPTPSVSHEDGQCGEQEREQGAGGSEYSLNLEARTGRQPVAVLAIQRGTRVLVFPEGAVDLSKAWPATFVSAVKATPGICMVESLKGIVQSVEAARVVCQPFRELRAKITLDAVEGDFTHKNSAVAVLRECFVSVPKDLGLHSDEYIVDIHDVSASRQRSKGRNKESSQSGPVNRLKLKLSVQFFNPDEDFEDEILTEMWTLLCFKRKKSGHEPLAWEAKPRKSGPIVDMFARERQRLRSTCKARIQVSKASVRVIGLQTTERYRKAEASSPRRYNSSIARDRASITVQAGDAVAAASAGAVTASEWNSLQKASDESIVLSPTTKHQRLHLHLQQHEQPQKPRVNKTSPSPRISGLPALQLGMSEHGVQRSHSRQLSESQLPDIDALLVPTATGVTSPKRQARGHRHTKSEGSAFP